MFDFFKTQKALKEYITDYQDELRNNIKLFHQGIKYYIENGMDDEFIAKVEMVHKSESRADDIRYALENNMYANSLLPDSRGDILGLIEALDKIPGVHEKLLHYIVIRKPKLPSEISDDLDKLITSSIEAAREAIDAFEILFTSPDKIKDMNDRIDELESRCDLLEKELLDKIFDLSIDELSKERIAKIVETISNIADKSEDVANRLVLAAIKRVM